MIPPVPRGMSRSRVAAGPRLLVCVLTLAGLCPVNPVAGETPQPSVASDGTLRGKQGDVVVVTIPVDDRPDHITGEFLQRTLTFFPVGNRMYAGLLGVDMQDRPGRYDLEIAITYPRRTERRRLSVEVIKETYPVQRLTLPKTMVDLDAPTLVRVKAESKAMRDAFDGVGPRPLWTETFREPVKGAVSGRFGSRRILNGQAKNPHSGEDIAAPEGASVRVMNAGVVRLTMDHFFTGHGVIVDHGLGLFSMYFHLSRVDVEQGMAVEKGRVIGAVGATGRATGPHLHWGVRLNGARVNPYSMLAPDVGAWMPVAD